MPEHAGSKEIARLAQEVRKIAKGIYDNAERQIVLLKEKLESTQADFSRKRSVIDPASPPLPRTDSRW